jgi:hypothetical protein
MAKTKTLEIRLHRKMSDNNFGSIGAEVSRTVELEAGDKPTEVRDKVLRSLEKDLEEAFQSVVAAQPTVKSSKKN